MKSPGPSETLEKKQTKKGATKVGSPGPSENKGGTRADQGSDPDARDQP